MHLLAIGRCALYNSIMQITKDELSSNLPTQCITAMKSRQCKKESINNYIFGVLFQTLMLKLTVFMR